MRIISWNVNGLRAVYRKNQFPQLLHDWQPDIFCVQETKSHPDQLPAALRTPAGYNAYYSSAEKKGYSGVALYAMAPPQRIKEHWGESHYQQEGRILQADYPDFTLYNIYFPNGRASADRLAYKMQFYRDFAQHLSHQLETQPNIIICGDVNTAHQAIDLARPKPNADKSGFLPQERAWIDQLLALGFVDSFRYFSTAPHHYTYWDMITRARERNVGWRIDYFFVSQGLLPRLQKADIHAEVMGSDHCPISIEIGI